MGRPPSNGGPSFRFNQAEIAEMEAILQAHRTAMPERQVLVSLAEKFSKSEERLGKIEVQMKQVWNWFQNRRYAIRAKAAKAPGKLNITQTARDGPSAVKVAPQVTQPHAASTVNVRSLPQGPQHPTVPSASVRTFPQAPQHPPAFSVQSVGRVADNSQMEYEAKSARDGAWYDVSTFLSHRSIDTGDPEVLVRFAGFGAEEDEWVNVRKNVRQRSLPCEASECVAVLPSDLILCFQEGKEQALYFDAHVLDAQRRRHDVRGCRCRFLVRYDHDQSEEIVALRKICRRPETDYRLQQLHAVNESIAATQNKNVTNNNSIHTVSTLRVYPPAEVQPKQHKVEPAVPPEAPPKRQRLDSTVPLDGSQRQQKVDLVMANAPQNQQTVQASQEPEKVEPVVSVPTVQGSGENQNVAPVVPARSDEVPVELQKVQPLMPDPMTDSSEPVPSAEATHEGEPMLAEPQKETVVSGSSVEVPAELHGVQPDTSALDTNTEKPVLPVVVNEPVVVEEAIETKTEDPVVPIINSDQNVVQEAVETKTEEPVVLDSSSDPSVQQVAKTMEPVEPNVVQEAIETKTKEPLVPVSCNDPNVVLEAETGESMVPVDPNVAQEAKTEEPVVPVDSNVVQDAETKEPVVPVDPNVPQEAKTEESTVPVDPNVPQEAKIEENMVPVDSNVAQEVETEEPVVPVDPNVPSEAETEEPMVHVDSNVHQEAKTEEPMVPVDSNVAQEAKTEEPMMPVDSNVAQEAETEEPMVPVDSNVAQEAKTEEPLVPVDPNMPQAAETEEPLMPVDSNVVQEAETEEPMVPIDPVAQEAMMKELEVLVNDANAIGAEIEQPKVSDIMEVNEDKHANVAENVSYKVENMDTTPENAAVAMEE